MTASSLSSLRNGQASFPDVSRYCVYSLLLDDHFLGNVSRHPPGREPPGPGRVGQHGAVQLGAVPWP